MMRSMAFAGLFVLGTVAPAFADGAIDCGSQHRGMVIAAADGHGCSDRSDAWPSGTLQVDDRSAQASTAVGQQFERAAADCELV